MRPDFERFRTAVLGGEPDRVPLFDGVAPVIQERFLGRPIRTVEDKLEFLTKAGYDHVRVGVGLSSHLVWRSVPKEKLQIAESGNVQRTWSPEHGGIITTVEDFEKHTFPRPEDIDYSHIEETTRLLPEGMGIIVEQGHIFTDVWRMMGFETFAYALVDNLELVELMFERIGSLVLRVVENALSIEGVGGLMYPDDLAYKHSLLVSPEVYRKYLFPWEKKIGKICQKRDVLYIRHSDGDISSVVEDLIACGINALHPIEPAAMDIRQMKQKYGGRIGLLGNLNLAFPLGLGTPRDVEAEVKSLLRDVAPGGGYCLGSGNFVTDYIPFENYQAMIETALKYGHYPIDIPA